MERLKAAIEKASAERDLARAADSRAAPPLPGLPAGAEAGPLPPVPGAGPDGVPADPAPEEDRAAFWAALPEVAFSARRLARGRVVAAERTDPAHVAFDVLRTRVLKALRDNGWRRIAITSPTKGCGKTFVAVNLAISLARQPDVRTLLLDMDLRAPNVASTLGLREVRPIEPVLRGQVAPATWLLRHGTNLAIGINSQRVRDSAEIIQARGTGPTLAGIVARLAPDVAVFDLPPMLAGDDAIATLPYVDCVLLVAGGGQTRPEHVEACERLLAGTTPLLGVLLNRAEDAASDLYGYG